MSETKVCSRCFKTKTLESFLKAGKVLLTCHPCREYARMNLHKNRRANPGRVRAHNLRYVYGISVEEYDALREAQGYRCRICRTHESEIKTSTPRGRPRKDGTPNETPFQLFVDHCHDSGRNRSLLCAPCNIGLGCFKDSPERLLAAVRYLREWSRDPVAIDPSTPR